MNKIADFAHTSMYRVRHNNLYIPILRLSNQSSSLTKTSIHISAFIFAFGFTKYNEPSRVFHKASQIMSFVNVIHIEMYELLWQTLYMSTSDIPEYRFTLSSTLTLIL